MRALTSEVEIGCGTAAEQDSRTDGALESVKVTTFLNLHYSQRRPEEVPEKMQLVLNSASQREAKRGQSTIRKGEMRSRFY